MVNMLKRGFDFLISLVLLIILLPVFVIIGLLVFIKMGSPIFFTQIRPGLDGEPFKMVKFRTMTNEKDQEGKLLPNEKRKTRFGNFLRSTSIDELPEIFNVLKGEMSLVGPRPLLMDYLPFFSEEQNRRHNVKPGITGWAQVNGRNAIKWDKKLELDVWYVDKHSFLLDLKILILTVYKVFNRDGINHDGDKFMPRFDEYVKEQKVNS